MTPTTLPDIMAGPRAAVGTFPYPHKTVAEVWAEQDRGWQEAVRELSKQGFGIPAHRATLRTGA